jgi:chromate transporter
MSGSVGVIQIFFVIFFSSLLSIGGGNGPTTIIQSQWVDHGILDPGLFTWVIALSYLTPGPKSGYLSGIGYFMAGYPGVIASLAGIIIPTCLGAAAVSYELKRLQPIIKKISVSAGFIIAAMIFHTAWGTALPLNLGGWDWFGVAVVFILIVWRNIPAVWVVLGSAAIGLLLSWLT